MPDRWPQPIPYGRQTLDQTDIDAVVTALQSPYLTQGPAIDSFEAAVAQYCGVAHAVAFSSGTAALHAACVAAELGPEDEAITSPITFVASSNAVLYASATPRFADIRPDTWNLDPARVAEAITPRTKALIPVHFSGEPVDLDAFYAIAQKHNLTVIEDAAHALGSRACGQPIGRCRDMAVFSFHPVKSVTTGEGGMVVTPHAHFAQRLRDFRTHGITRDADRIQYPQSDAPWYYEMQSLGYNYRITDIQAALGTSQMGKLDAFVARRDQIVRRYLAALGTHPACIFQQRDAGNQSAHHLCVLRLNPDGTTLTREALFARLAEANIRSQVHYIPVTWQPYYRERFGMKPGDFPQADAYYRHALSLPIYPTLTDAEQDFVIETIRSALNDAYSPR